MAAGVCDCGGSIVFDPDVSATVCSSCGHEYGVDLYISTDLPTTGGGAASAWVNDDFTYHARKCYLAKTLISDIVSRLGLSSRYQETLALVSQVTVGSFGAGEWFSVLAAAAAYVVARRNRVALSLSEAADAAGADGRQISGMVSRILSFLDSGQLPHFDPAGALDRALRECHCFSELDDYKRDEVIATGKFLIQCMTKWFLMTGRKPLPAVAAVAALAAEINGVLVDVGEIAKGIYAIVSTSRTRLRELKETLVKVAQALLPWGKDVNPKNLAHHMPMLIRVMESKARKKSEREGRLEGEPVFNLDEYLNSTRLEEEDSSYFRIGQEERVDFDEVSSMKISADRISGAYRDALVRISDVAATGGFDGGKERRKRMREFEYDGLWGSWEGRWDLGKKLSLKEVLERDIGYDAPPPSFVRSEESRERRKLKIEAAKQRIKQSTDLMYTNNLPLLVQVDPKPVNSKPVPGKRRRRTKAGHSGIDWEDCITELLLLHRVDENEIEGGQYRRLLDLHVFSAENSLSTER